MKPKNRVAPAIIAAMVLAAGIYVLSGVTSARAESKTQRIVIHLSHYSDNSHSALMAVHFAQYLQEHGADVTLMLDVEGVRLADRRHGAELCYRYERTNLPLITTAS